MFPRRGFTLIETLIATFVLSSGLVAVAWLFAYSVKTDLNNQQRTVATVMLYEKIEEFKAMPLNDPAWAPGEYSDYEGRYLRRWQISGTISKTLTVVVYTERAGLTNRMMELSRATTMVSP